MLEIEFKLDLDGIILFDLFVGGNDATDEFESIESFLLNDWVCCLAF